MFDRGAGPKKQRPRTFSALFQRSPVYQLRDLRLAQVERADGFRDAQRHRALEPHGLRVHEDRVVEGDEVVRARLVRRIAERDAHLAARLVHRQLRGP